MAKHDVFFEVPTRKLGRSDVSFSVKSDGETLGTLTVSNGSVVWFPRGTTNGFKMGWPRFDKIMREHARRVERR